MVFRMLGVIFVCSPSRQERRISVAMSASYLLTTASTLVSVFAHLPEHGCIPLTSVGTLGVVTMNAGTGPDVHDRPCTGQACGARTPVEVTMRWDHA